MIPTFFKSFLLSTNERPTIKNSFLIFENAHSNRLRIRLMIDLCLAYSLTNMLYIKSSNTILKFFDLRSRNFYYH